MLKIKGKDKIDMTNKQAFNYIVEKAKIIDLKLDKLRKECDDLILKIEEFGDERDYDMYITQLKWLKDTLSDLSNFDLEDSIPLKATQEF